MDLQSQTQTQRKANLPGLIGLSISLILIGSALSLPYLLLIRNIPSVKLNIIVTVLFGLLIGFLGSKLCLLFKARNGMLTIIAGTVGILGYNYVKWSMFLSYTLLEWTKGKTDFAGYLTLLPDFLKNPAAFIEAMIKINQTGTWSYGESSDPVTGIFLALIWIGELLILSLIPLYMIHDQATRPFIESEKSWAIKTKEKFFCRLLPVENPAKDITANPEILFESIERSNLLSNLNHIEVTLFHSKDYLENYIDVTQVMIVSGKKNGRQERRIVRNLPVDHAFASTLHEKAGIMMT